MNSVKMVKEEFKHMGEHKLLIATICAMMIIPFLYSVFFLKSVWDPYGNSGSLPVAVVNKDQPVSYKGKKMQVGKDLVKKLKKNDQLDWHFVSASKAQYGISHKKYYTVVTIPKNFSKNATTILDKNPKKMRLKYETNDSLNYIGKVISEVGVKQLNTQVRQNVSKAYAETMFAMIKKVGTGFNTAAKGADKLTTGSNTLSDGINTYTAGVKKVGNGVMELQTGVVPLSTGVLKLTTGATALNNGVQQYTAGVAAANNGTQKLNSSTGTLATGVNKLANGSNTLANGVGTYTNGVAKIDNGVQTLNGSTGTLATGVGKLANGSNTLTSGVDTYTTGVSQVNSGLKTLNGKTGSLSSGVSALSKGSSTLSDGIKEYTGGVGTIENGLAKTVGTNNQNSKDLRAGVNNLKSLPNAAAALYITNKIINENIAKISTGLSSQNIADMQSAIVMLQALAKYYQQYSATLNNLSGLQNSLTTVSNGLTTISQNSNSISDATKTLQADSSLNAEDKKAVTTIIDSNNKNLHELQLLQSSLSGVNIKDIQGAVTGLNGLMKNANLTQEKLAALSTAGENMKNLSTAVDSLSQVSNQALSTAQKLNSSVGNGTDVDVASLTNEEAITAAVTKNATGTDINKLISGVNTYTAGVDQLASGASTLNNKSAALITGASSMNTGLNSLNSQVPALTSGVATLFNGSEKLDANSQSLVDGASQLSTGLGTLNGKVPALTAGVSQLAAGTNQLVANNGTLNSGANQLSSGLGTLNGNVPTLVSGVSQLASGTQKLANNSSTLNSGASQLAGGLSTLNNKVPTLSSGVNQLASGTQQLDANSGKLTSGSNQLATGNKMLAKSLNKGAKQVNAVKTSNKTANMFAAPSNLQHSNYSKVPNYGYALAPYMLSVALYVGSLIFNLVYPIRRMSTEGSGTAWFLSKVTVGALVATGNALIEVIFMKICGLVPMHPASMIVNALFFSYSAMFLIMFMSILGNNPGRFVAMIFLVIQLGACGGSFPIQVTNGMNGFFQAINPYLPMTYSVLGFRQSLNSGLGQHQVLISVGVLSIFIVVCLFLLWLTMTTLVKKGIVTYEKDKSDSNYAGN
ncbi:MAG: YhgE/Pip domain-containing protein [Liquorilactobacillus ghanensis]